MNQIPEKTAFYRFTTTQTRFRPAVMVKTVYADTIGACPSNQDGKRILTINLCGIRKGREPEKIFIDLGVPKV